MANNNYKSHTQYPKLQKQINEILKNANTYRVKVKYISSANNNLGEKVITITQQDINKFKNNPSLLMTKEELSKQNKDILNEKRQECYKKINNIITYANDNKDALTIKKFETQLDNLIAELFDKVVTNVNKLLKIKKTIKKLFDVDDNDAREYEEEHITHTKSHSSTKISDSEINNEEELSVQDSLALGTVSYMIGKELYKNDKLNKLRKEVKELEKEYDFEQRYDPSWDTDECLASKYKDEEQYLKARKEELQRKNLAYNNYLDPRERECLGDETEGFTI